jgi:hypothetical protein
MAQISMKAAYNLVCSMEDGLDTVEKLARALMMMVENLGDDAEPIIEVAQHIRDRARALENCRGELCRLLQRLNRVYFDPLGRRGDEAA